MSWLRRILNRPAAAKSAPSAASAKAAPIAQVIVYARGSVERLSQCLASVLRSLPARDLLIVHDSNDERAAEYLAQFAADHGSTLIQNLDFLGYWRSIRKAASLSTAEYLVLLDSDVIVTTGCLRELIEELQADPSAQVAVGLFDLQLTRCFQTSRESGQQVAGFLSSASSELIAAALETAAIPGSTLSAGNSFPGHPCFAVRRSALADLASESRSSSIQLRVAPRCYGSYQNSQLDPAYAPILEAISAYLAPQLITSFRRVVSDAPFLPEILDRSVLFLLPSPGGGGGAHSVVQEVIALRECGVDATIANRVSHRRAFEQCYPETPAFCSFYADDDELLELARRAAVVIATNHASVLSLQAITQADPYVTPLYYVQDYEPWFYPSDDPRSAAASASYTLVPNARAFAKTRWLCQTVSELARIDVAKIEPSLDRSLYNGLLARPQAISRPVAITAMIRPSSARRNPRGTLSALRQIQQKHGANVDIRVFGCADEDLDPLQEAQGFRFVNLGELKRWEVAGVLRGAAIFVDLSSYQAFGCTGLEAMAAGCATVLPRGSGVEEYAQDQHNSLLVDAADGHAAVAAIERLIADENLMRRIRSEALVTGRRYSVRKAAWSLLNLFGECLAARDESPVGGSFTVAG